VERGQTDQRCHDRDVCGRPEPFPSLLCQPGPEFNRCRQGSPLPTQQTAFPGGADIGRHKPLRISHFTGYHRLPTPISPTGRISTSRSRIRAERTKVARNAREVPGPKPLRRSFSGGGESEGRTPRLKSKTYEEAADHALRRPDDEQFVVDRCRIVRIAEEIAK